MKKLTPAERKALSALQKKLKVLETNLVDAKRREGIDEYVSIKVEKRDARFTREKVEGGPDKATGRFLLFIKMTAKQTPVFVPLSAASGKNVAGFMYVIEGTGEGNIATAEVSVRGEGVAQVTMGTLQFAKIPKGRSATFRLDVTIRGRIGKQYQIVINRINYKLALADARYQQYLKPIPSEKLKFS